MNNAEFQLRGVGDPRLAVHATSALPVWLWSTDGTRILWANPVGAKLFGAANGAALAGKTFGPADPHRRQMAQLWGRLSSSGAIRLERLRGFGAPLGQLMTCGCARLEFADGSHGILVSATETAGRTMPLLERLQRLVEGIDRPIAAFARDGMFVGASEAARALLGFRNLTEAGLDAARDDALAQGRVETSIGIGHMVLQRVGSGADVGLVALIEPAATPPAHIEPAAPVLPQPATAEPALDPVAPPAERPMPDYERPAISGEAPAEFALIDEFENPSAEAAIESVMPEAPPEQDTSTAPAPEQPDVEAMIAQPSMAAATPQRETDRDEPSPDVEAAAADVPSPVAVAAPPRQAPPWLDESATNARRHPLRFMWQMDAEGRFSLGSDEFSRLIGAHTSAGFGRLWGEIADHFGLDPDGRVARAVATHDTWSGITLNWPVDGGERLPVELSGLPVYDRSRNFAGYRGFGVCRDLDGLTRLAALRRYELFSDPPAPEGLAADIVQGSPTEELSAAPAVASSTMPEMPESIAVETSQQTDLETPVETPKNVLPFRPVGEAKSPVLTPVENSAFNELARQLSARLETESSNAAAAAPSDTSDTSEPAEVAVELPVQPLPADVSEQPHWLAEPEPPARGETRRDKTLLDLLPVGVLIYRLDRLLYANTAFLGRIGYPSLHALEEAGGLEALYVEPGVSSASSTSDTGTPVTISASPFASETGAPEAAPLSPTDARLYTISWDDDSALALIFSAAAAESRAIAVALAEPIPVPTEPSAVGQANAEELGAILDTTAEGILMFDAEGNINAGNRSAEALFGFDGSELVQRNLAELFAPESQRAVMDYLASIKGAGVASLLESGREARYPTRGIVGAFRADPKAPGRRGSSEKRCSNSDCGRALDYGIPQGSSLPSPCK